MNLDLWLCETNDIGTAIWVSGSDVSLEPFVSCRRLERGSRDHTIAGKVLRDIERLTGETP